jgi:two-component system, cell cycle sensor histidine kinase PleC
MDWNRIEGNCKQLKRKIKEALTFQAEKDELIAELEHAKANSDLARRRAEAANLATSRFLAAISHELRTPVNVILGFSEVMKGELFGSHAIASYKEYSNDIHASGQHLLMLINEILDLSRIEAGRFDLKEEVVALTHIVEDCGHSCWQKSGRSPWKRPSNRISHGFGPTNVLFVK